ncbi:MAG TPA: nodulation protein NfeD [Candidatus Hydrothermia bacterium]|nr:nodulation protein NfeD [Candidatus Hydrothermae bacterium]MDD3649487.1 nodulation protein NfeD [Candidatus Hydrothermia bacterium]HOL23503.1 nodulation protein NfeD [Candidatus Hydrothermia bacterium]HOP32235.1 nodulation protein NfeD [Candidatus Hydrothermia bacterium]HRD22830.1 nodulation protein NfeD [Candidatus Hydrothermia bacterium]
MKALILSILLTTAEIYKISIDSPITPPIAEYVTKGIEKANSSGGKLILLIIDTPGGLDESMRTINKSILASQIPVVTYVYPEGARAASAGAFIAMASHIIAMAPGTSIGACHPVAIGQQMDSIMIKKVANDAAAYLKSLAELYGRNKKWAEEAVYDARSSSSEEALREKVVEYIAENEIDLLDKINGTRVNVNKTPYTITLAKPYQIQEVNMGFREKLLSVLSNPNIAYILLILGFYGLFFELSNPGAIFPGVIGAISLILAFYSLQTLPVNYAGVALLILSLALFVLEVFVESAGVLAIGGIVSFILGSLMLFEGGTVFRVSLPIIIICTALTAAFFLWIVTKGVSTLFLKPETGIEGMLGEKGIAKTNIDTKGGTCLVHGELWNARSEEPISKGEEIEVIKVDGLTLWVRKRENN